MQAASPPAGAQRRNASIDAFWAGYCARAGLPPQTPMQAWPFGDSTQLAHELVDLVIHGPKRATAGLAAWNDLYPEDAAVPDGYSIVTEYDGTPRCVIRTTWLDVRPLREVDAAFAWDEGEGDRTLADWLDGHRRYFGRVCPPLGIAFSDDIEVRLADGRDAAATHRRHRPGDRPRAAEDRSRCAAGGGVRRPGQPARGRPRAGDRQPVQRRPDRDRRHRQRARAQPRGHHHVRELHPDRRRDQPRQFGRRAGRRRRPPGRHQHRDLLARRRQPGHRLRDPGRPRAPGAGRAAARRPHAPRLPRHRATATSRPSSPTASGCRCARVR